jgi:hypothetical protein
MKRLRDEDSELEASDEKLAALFAVAEPYGSDPFRKRRVLVKLLSERDARAPRILRGALVAAVLAVTASAAAVGGIVGGWWSEPLPQPPQPSAVHAPSPVAAQPTESSLNAPPEAAKDSEPAPAPAVEAPKPSPKPEERARGKRSEDPAQVLDAMKALRAEGDPAKAQTLLNDYMKRNPNGMLSEDALALSIEAAAARRDPRAKDYARRYLAQFPNGKYRALATRALER